MGFARTIRHVEQFVLLLVAGLTIGAVGVELYKVYERQDVAIADILLLFIYTEVLSMVAVYMESRRVPVTYPLLIANTALARLIVLQGKDMDPQNVLFEAVAILVLALSIVILRLGDGLRFLHLFGHRPGRRPRPRDAGAGSP
ncbi:MAG: phosphate-starvation-inducible PsiE family protein [Pseudomonadota bacterium]